MVEKLPEKGASADIETEDGLTALMLASSNACRARLRDFKG